MAKKRDKQEAKAAKGAAKAERQQHRRKAQGVLSSAEIAEQLRALASQVETGIFSLGDAEIDLPPHADFEIGYKQKKRGGHQIEVEIEWGGLTHTPLLPSE